MYEVAELLKSVAEAKSVALEVPARNGQLMARADSDKITQVLTNLVINAVKFTPSGGKGRLDAGAVKRRQLASGECHG